MDFNTVRSAILENQYFRQLTPQTQGLLLRNANLRTAEKGYIIYQEGESLDDTFCLLLEGELLVKKDGAEIGEVDPWELFGETAFFTKLPSRSASIVVDTSEAIWAKWKITRDDLNDTMFQDLKRVLEEKTGATL